MDRSPTVFVAGMHRSGTSLTAQALQQAGFHMGRELVEASDFNPRGYVEPASLVDFHDRLLRANGTAWPDPRSVEEPLRWPDPWPAEARQLLDLERHPELPTALKDPRTTLFLGLWLEAAPDACFVLPFREPAPVVRSLLRRGDLRGRGRVGRARTALRLWRGYNERLLALHEERPDRCVLVAVPDDQVERPLALDAVVRDRWGIVPPAPIDLGAAYERPLLHDPPGWIKALVAADRRAQRTVARLREAAGARTAPVP